MRFLPLLSLWMIFLSSSAGASHLQFYSGSIEWENDSANYFTFHLYLVAGCQQLSTSTPQQLSLMVDGLPVLVNLSSNTILHDGCTPNPWSCSYSPGKFKQRLLHYTSSSYPLTFAPGQNSIEVWYSMGLGRRTGNLDDANDYSNFYLRSRMYAAGFPRSSPHVQYTRSTLRKGLIKEQLFDGIQPHVADSVWVESTNVLDYGVIVPYDSGYSVMKPLDSLVTFDEVSGNMSGIMADSSRVYTVARRIESYFDGQLTADIHTEGTFLPQGGFYSLDERQHPRLRYNGTRNGVATLGWDTLSVSVYVPPGDTAIVNFKALADTGSTLSITAHDWTLNPSLPILRALPGSSLTNPGDSVEFEWRWYADSNAFAGPHRTIVQIKDDGCPAMYEFITVVFRTQADDIPVDTLVVCPGARVTLPNDSAYANMHWFPHGVLDSDIIQRPSYVMGQTDITFVLTSNGVPVHRFYIHPEVLMPPVISNNPALTSTFGMDSLQWIHFNVPIPAYGDTLNAPGYGEYRVRRFTPYCDTVSSSFAYQLNGFQHVTLSTKECPDDDVYWAQDSSITYVLRRNANGSQWFSGLVLPDIQLPITGTQRIKVELLKDGTPHWSGYARPHGLYGMEIQFPYNGTFGGNMTWEAGHRYTVTLTMEGGGAWVARGLSWQVDKQFGEYELKQYRGLSGVSEMYPIVLRMTSTVSEEEWGMGVISVYPNPASQSIQVANLPEGASWTISDAFGRVILRGQHSGKPIDLSTLANGWYVFTANGERRKLLIQR